MAIDSPEKRACVTVMGMPWMLRLLPVPAGSIQDLAQNHFDGLCAGAFFTTPIQTYSNLLDAVYVITKRHIEGTWVYYSERMDDRQWGTVEDVWCLDAALALPVFAPQAALQVDANAATVGATATFTNDGGLFASHMVGDVIRAGGGSAVIVSVESATSCTVTIVAAFVGTLQLDGEIPPPFIANLWTIAVPVTTIHGLNHLEGEQVVVLADGGVITGLTVTGGQITLPQPASMVLVGLPFTAQMQTLPLDVPGEATIQGKRKNIYAVTVRVEQSRGFQVGSNQVDFSAYPEGTITEWENLVTVKDRSALTNAGLAVPLYTNDVRVNIPGTWRKPGQVSVQQTNPLPLSISAVMPEVVVGDDNG